MSEVSYSEIPERAKILEASFVPPEELIEQRNQLFASVSPRQGDKDGDEQVLDGVTFTHHFVEVPGDYETVQFHYVEAGSAEAIVFLHGIPDRGSNSTIKWLHYQASTGVSGLI